MSSATASLFASFALAGLGAAGLAYTLTHPGVLAALLDRAGVAERLATRTTSNHSRGRDTSSTYSGPTRPGTITLPAGHNGHFLTEADINGSTIRVMVDTGASRVALSYNDASHAGIFVRPSDYTYIARTANGTTRVAPVIISEIRIGDITLRNVKGVVSQRGDSDVTLLGMSFLGRLSRVEMHGDSLLLEE
jgi:aspartyl protease family protein